MRIASFNVENLFERAKSLRLVAVDNGRSLNAEIVQRLRRSFEEPDPTTTAAVVDVGEEER